MGISPLANIPAPSALKASFQIFGWCMRTQRPFYATSLNLPIHASRYHMLKRQLAVAKKEEDLAWIISRALLNCLKKLILATRGC